MNIAEEVQLILDDNLVSHGYLKLNALSQSKHHAVTDYEKVYVKVLKPGTMSHANMLQTEIDFSFSTNYGTNPLMDGIVHKNSKGRTMILSAWEFEQQIPVIYNATPIHIAQAAQELYRIHSFPQYETLRYDAAEEFRDYAICLNSYSFRFLTPDHQNKIKNIYRDVVKPATDSLTLNSQTNVVSHGQAILEKVALRPNGVQWVDYESVRSAPREYDASQMFLELHHRINRPDLWAVFRQEYETSLGRPLNNALLEEFALLHLGRQALKLASTTLHTMNSETLMSLLQDITSLITGKNNLVRMSFRTPVRIK